MSWGAAVERRQPRSMGVVGCGAGPAVVVGGEQGGPSTWHKIRSDGVCTTGQRTAAAAVAGVDWCSIERWESGISFA